MMRIMVYYMKYFSYVRMYKNSTKLYLSWSNLYQFHSFRTKLQSTISLLIIIAWQLMQFSYFLIRIKLTYLMCLLLITLNNKLIESWQKQSILFKTR